MNESVIKYLTDFFYVNFIKEGLIVIIACFVIGAIVKHLIPKVNNNWIVPIVSVCGIVLALAMPMSGDTNKVLIGAKGLIMGWASTGGFEFVRGLIRLGIVKIPGVDKDKLDQVLDNLDKDKE